MDSGLDTHLRCLADDGSRDISARSDNEVGLEVIDDLLGPSARVGEIMGGLEIAPDIPDGDMPLEALDLDGLEAVARLRNQLRLQLIGVAGEAEFGIGMMFLYYFSDGKSGVDMTRGTAACK